ncbi:MAG: hypothetical protein QJR14_04045 [Bacillota bacterium]|nr:hypothetical protein [Bacillota bacterium]
MASLTVIAVATSVMALATIVAAVAMGILMARMAAALRSLQGELDQLREDVFHAVHDVRQVTDDAAALVHGGRRLAEQAGTMVTALAFSRAFGRGGGSFWSALGQAAAGALAPALGHFLSRRLGSSPDGPGERDQGFGKPKA